MLTCIRTTCCLLFAVHFFGCQETRDVSSNQQVFRGTGIPAAIAVNGLIDVNRSDGNLVVPKPFENKTQHDVTSLEVQRSFVVVLDAPMSFLSVADDRSGSPQVDCVPRRYN